METRTHSHKCSIRGISALDPWMWPLSVFQREEVVGGDSAVSPPSSVPATDNHSLTPYLVMHTEYFQWPANFESEHALVRAVRSVMHLRVQDAGHNNFTDTGFLSPVISGRVMTPKKTGMQDPVILQELINDMLTAFLFDSYNPISMDSSDTMSTSDASNITVGCNLNSSGTSLNRSLSLAQKTKCFEILETRW